MNLFLDAICYDDEDLQPEPENYPTKQINFGKRFLEADPDPYPIPVLNEGYKSWNKKSKVCISIILYRS